MGRRFHEGGRALKKLWNFLRSMRFGMVLLAVIVAVSFVGSLVPQGSEAMWYVENFPNAHRWIFLLGADHLFSTWYFVGLVGLLCANLLLCSVVRVGRVRRAAGNQVRQAAAVREASPLNEKQRALLEDHLRAARYSPTEMEDCTVWTKNRLGFYGSFLTHLGILLVFVVGGAVLACSDVRDYTAYPGQDVVLEDGTTLRVEDFRIEDETGKLDFTSHITVTLPDGTADGPAEISVNHPHSFRNHKFYQQTYGTCGSITVEDETGGTDTFTVDEVCFLSADGVSGIWYEALYPGYVRDEEGNFTLITSTAGAYSDPVYQVLVCGTEGRTPVLAMPGESVEVGGLTFTFNEPISYPGIRVKTLPSAVIGALYGTFVLLIFALWLTFFHVPAAVAVRPEGYAIYGAKTAGTALELGAVLGEPYAPDREPEEEKSPEEEPEESEEEPALC